MSKRQADLDLEAEIDIRSPASKKPRFAGADAPTVEESRDTTASATENDNRNGPDHADGQRSNERSETEAHEREDSPVDFDETLPVAPQRQSQPVDGYSDLYLDTINRAVLDFDFEKLCSISLSNINVYACLVCGKYFQGRGTKSHAYFHALDVGHHVFVNMETKKVYVLPEGYEVKSKSLDDIKYVVDPTYTKVEVMKLDKELHEAWDLLGKKYRPG